MNVHQISDEQLIAFAAGELQGEAAAVVRQHIASCASCSARVRRFHFLREVLRTDDTEAPPLATLARAQAIMVREPRYTRIAARPRPVWLPLRQRAALLAAALVLLLLGGLTQGAQVAGAASESALPGDGLYPVKTTLEGLQLAFTPETSAQVQLRLGFAQKRVTEVQQLSQQQRFRDVGTAVAGYETQVAETTKSLSTLAANDPQHAAQTASRAIEVIAGAGAALNALRANVPAEQRPVVTHAVEESSASVATLRGKLENLPGRPATATASSTATGEPSTPTASATPKATDTRKPTAPPSAPLNTPPGQANTPPGQVLTPPGQANTPPGQVNTPPGQAKTPPGQDNHPEQDKTPPGQDKNPPGQEKDPPGQDKEPPGQVKDPPGKTK